MVAGSKECEGSPLSLIDDGWLLTELHRQWLAHHRRRLSLIAVVGAQRRRWELNRNGVWLFVFFFFLTKYCRCVITVFDFQYGNFSFCRTKKCHSELYKSFYLFIIFLVMRCDLVILFV